MSDGGFGTDAFADEVLSDDVVDFDPLDGDAHSAWDDGDEITATGLEVVPTRKRKCMAAAHADDMDDGATAAGIGGDATGIPADAHGLATKKRRRKYGRSVARDVQRHCQRKAELGTARGGTSRSDPDPAEGRPAEDWAEW